MSIASGMSTASRRGGRKKKRGKGKKGSKPKRKKGGFLSALNLSKGHSSSPGRGRTGSVCGSVAGSVYSEASSINSRIDKNLLSLAKKTQGKGDDSLSDLTLIPAQVNPNLPFKCGDYNLSDLTFLTLDPTPN